MGVIRFAPRTNDAASLTATERAMERSLTAGLALIASSGARGEFQLAAPRLVLVGDACSFRSAMRAGRPVLFARRVVLHIG
jgi:hypothetical protein